MGGDFNMAPDEWLDRYPSYYKNYCYNQLLKEFMNVNSLIDVWRQKNPLKKQYSWIKLNGRSRSRIDFWLASPETASYVKNTSISGAENGNISNIKSDVYPSNLVKSDVSNKRKTSIN